MSDPKNPVPGDQHIDASDLVLVDITTEEIGKLLKLHDGSDKAIDNAKRLTDKDVAKAGINPDDFQVLLGIIADYERASAFLPSAEKLVELLYETKMERAHHMSVMFGEICSQARRRAKRDPKGAQILGPMQDLLDYHYGPARQGAVTRVKNAKVANGANGTSAAPEAAPAGTPQ